MTFLTNWNQMTATSRLAALSTAAMLCAACADAPRSVDRADPDLVLQHLLPGVLVEGEPDPEWTLAERREHYGIPGVSIALVVGNDVEWVRADGVMAAGGEGDLDPGTRFQAKSVAKTVTAFGTLRLAEEGVLDLDAPASAYLRRWSIPENEFTATRQPTLAQILSHSGGFTVWGVPSYAPGRTLPTLLQAIQGIPPAAPEPVTIDYVPGTASRYSGGGYSVLQLLLEDATAESFPSLMERLVFQPLSMRASLFAAGVPDSLAAVTARGHGEDGAPMPGWDAHVQMAAGGLLTNARDLGRFVAELNRAWLGESTLLSQELARRMMTEVTGGFGLGVELAGRGDSLVYSHTGSGDGFRALIVGVPARRAGAVVLTNSDVGGELRYEIVRAIAEALDWPAYRPERRDTTTVDPARLAALAGQYEYSDGSRTTVSFEAGSLYAAWRTSPPTKLYAEGASDFFTKTGEAFAFVRDDEGRGSSLTWSGSFGAFTAQRVP